MNTHTVTIHEGVRERIDLCIAHLSAEAKKEHLATDEADLHRIRAKNAEATESFLYGLVRIMRSNPHDGNVEIATDSHSPMSFFFRHPGTGYCGGLNYFASDGKWSVNT